MANGNGNIHSINLNYEGSDAIAGVAELSEEAMKQVVKIAINKAHAEWSELARQKLHRTQADYLGALKMPEYGEGTASVTLEGKLANAIECGQEAYDMHDTLLGANVPVVERGSGQKGKYRKKDNTGFYRFIPFRHSGPGTVGAVGTPMGQAYRGHADVEDARQLGKQVYAMAKGLTPTRQEKPGSRKVNWQKGLDVASFVPKLKPYHTTNIYQGMQKIEKTYDHARQNTFMTFRTISTNSPNWRRKATVGVHFCEQVRTIMEAEMPAIVAMVLGQKGAP